MATVKTSFNLVQFAVVPLLNGSRESGLPEQRRKEVSIGLIIGLYKLGV